jgi:release factor glutamine methyltransferase
LSGDEAFLAAEVLLAHVLGRSREEIFVYNGDKVSDKELGAFKGLFERFYKGEPVAYLINKKEFFGLDFYVDGNVLIPRPETEILVEKVIDFVKKSDNGEELVSVLDLGTGCGNIALSIAKNLNNVHVTAADVSANALEVAKKNAVNFGVQHKVDFVYSDLLENVAGEFDVVVANLPYIGERKHRYISKEAQEYEPSVALFGGENGLTLYERLFRQMVEHEWKPELFLGEFGFLQGDEVKGLLSNYFSGKEWCIEKDLASIERIFMVRFS